MLLLISRGVSLNPGSVHQKTLQCSNEWKFFKNRGSHFINLSINSLLSKIEELCCIANSTDAAIIAICESKLDVLMLDPGKR